MTLEVLTSEQKPEVIFVSHDTTESRIVDDFSDLLREVSDKKLTCFVAQGSSKNERLQPSDEWRSRIINEISNSLAVVCVLTKKSSKRPWVNYELGMADAQKKAVAGLVLDLSPGELGNHPITDRFYSVGTVPSVVNLIKWLLEKIGVTTINEVEMGDKVELFLRKAIGYIESSQRSYDIEKNHKEYVNTRIHELSTAARNEYREAERLKQVDYIDRFKREALALGEGDYLWAICGDKNWDSDEVFEYLAENGKAAERGAKVFRIYIEPEDGFDPWEWGLIERHLEWEEDDSVDFKVKVLIGNKAKKAHYDFRLPEGFGLVLPVADHSIAMMHYGLTNKERRAVIFENKLLVDIYKKIHRELAFRASRRRDVEKRLAEIKGAGEIKYHPFIERSPKHRSKQQ